MDEAAVANKALIVIDVQNDFTTGALGSPEAAAKVDAIVETAKAFRGSVFLTKDTHGADYLDTQEGVKLPVTHCVKDTPGWQLSGGLEELALDRGWKVFEKPTFGSVELSHYVADLHRKGQLDAVELVGFCTDICVVSNALLIKAYAPELSVRVDPSLCAGTTPEAHTAALRTLQSCQIDCI